METPWGGIACCLSAAALFMLGRNSGRDAAVLNSVTRVNQVKDLVKLLDIGTKLLPLIVAISGKVGSTAPIKCDCSGLRGVIVEETAEQLFLKHNDVGSWIQDSALILSLSKEVPWYLDDGTGKVCVVGARGAAGFVYTVCSEVFEESGRSLVRGTLDYLQGLKMLGVKRIERVLPTGTSLTVIGEVVKDDIGTMRIQKPIKGPFYVSTRSLDELIGNLGKWARLYKLASLTLTLYGSFAIVKHVLYYFMARKRQREYQDRVFAAAAKKGEKCENLLEENKSDRKVPDLCVVCLEKEYDAVFLKCGHMCCCVTCASYLNCCPLCRKKIDQVVKTFRH